MLYRILALCSCALCWGLTGHWVTLCAMSREMGWRHCEAVLDALLMPLERNHCAKCWARSVAEGRARTAFSGLGQDRHPETGFPVK